MSEFISNPPGDKVGLFGEPDVFVVRVVRFFAA